jgi:hypothetical protein
MNDQIQPNLSSDVQIIPSSKPSVVIIFDPSSTKSIGNAPPFTAAGKTFGFYAANYKRIAKTVFRTENNKAFHEQKTTLDTLKNTKLKR